MEKHAIFRGVLLSIRTMWVLLLSVSQEEGYFVLWLLSPLLVVRGYSNRSMCAFQQQRPPSVFRIVLRIQIFSFLDLNCYEEAQLVASVFFGTPPGRNYNFNTRNTTA